MKLGITGLVASALARPLYAQPIIYSGYEDIHLNSSPYKGGNWNNNWNTSRQYIGIFTAFTAALESQNFRPSFLDFLVMFSDKYVEKNGRYFAVKNSQGNGALQLVNVQAGLYEVFEPNTDSYNLPWCVDNQCAVFQLIYEMENLGQIIAAPEKYEPMQIIGVDQVTNKIYGFTPKNNYAYWERKQTVWGDAKSGSLSSTDGEVIGLSSNNRLFNLWGDFNYAKHDEVKCSGAPSSIDEWSGRLADYRGMYCPGAGNDQLWKATWHSSGWSKGELNWAPASRITRFESGIWGITTDGKLLILWNDAGTIRSAPIDLPSIQGVRAVGGLEERYIWDSGVLVTNKDDVVYNVWWDGKWKEKEIFNDKRTGDGKKSVFFGSYHDEMYMLYTWYSPAYDVCVRCMKAEIHLYHMVKVGGTERYQAVMLSKTTSMWWV